MSIAERIKNAIVPEMAGNEGAAISSNPRPECDIPGAFPDSDDEQEVERQHQREQELPPNTQPTTEQGSQNQRFFGDRGPVLSEESLGLSPDKHEIPWGSAHHRESHAGSPANIQSPALGGDEPPQNQPAARHVPDAEREAEERMPSEQPDFAMADRDTKTTQVRSQHLGNEGTMPPPRSPTTGQPKTEGQLETQANNGGDKPPSSSSDAASPIAEAESARESLGQYSGAGSTGQVEGNGGIRNGVLGRGSSHLGHSPQDHSPAAPAASAGVISGGVHNSVLGHGSEHPYGEGVESPVEERRTSSGSSGKNKAAAAAAVVISGVSDSGLGLGGVHNGVVGHGSHDEEDGRHHHQTGGEEA